MRKVIFVKQYLNEEHNNDTRFFVAFKDEANYGDMRFGTDYGLYNLPKYVKKFMANHDHEIWSDDCTQVAFYR